MELPDFDPLDDKFRWCVYCKADCWPTKEFQEHAGDCPTVTGRFPVDHEREKPESPHGCCRCEKEFKHGAGEFYRLILAPGEKPEGDEFGEKVYLVVCEDCAMQVELLGATT